VTVLHLVRPPDEVGEPRTHSSILELDRGYRELRAREADSFDAAVGRIMLARRLGEIVASLPTAQGRRDPNGAPTKQEALEQLGIRRQRAAEWEALAGLTEEELRGYFTAGRLRGEIGMAGALRLAEAKRRRVATDRAVAARVLNPALKPAHWERLRRSLEAEVNALASACAAARYEIDGRHGERSARSQLERIRRLVDAALAAQPGEQEAIEEQRACGGAA
jgi:hypothetical protein